MKAIDLTEIQGRIEARQAVCAPTSRESSQNSASRAIVLLTWQLMTSLFGHRWTSSYGTDVDPDGVWAATLAGLDDAQIRRGLRKCVSDQLDWPPSAPEFRGMCLGGTGSTWEQRRVEEADREFSERKLLEDGQKRERDEAVAFAAIVGIKELLGMGGR